MLSSAAPFIALLSLLCLVWSSTPVMSATGEKDDNIAGPFMVKFNHHYSNKTTVTWGQNGQKDWSVRVVLPVEAATYDCTNTTSYSCEDAAYMYDWNKLWGKARCGYTHDHHQDSDRFVFRKCKTPAVNCIEVAAYSYDAGVAPYTGENPNLLQQFQATISPNVPYILHMVMEDNGITTFSLLQNDSTWIESVQVQHTNLCEKNYYEGIVDGLYFGGTCRAPVDVVVTYSKV